MAGGLPAILHSRLHIKKKPNATTCEDNRTISSLTHASKVMIRILIEVTHLIEMSRMSANYISGKTAKYDQKSSFPHFHILLEMGT